MMTRQEAYTRGYREGASWAAQDWAESSMTDTEGDLRAEITYAASDDLRAERIGRLRGYRVAHHRLEIAEHAAFLRSCERYYGAQPGWLT